MQHKRSIPLRALCSLLLLCAILALPARQVSAEKTDWKDNAYSFSTIQRILLYDPNFSAAKGQEMTEFAEKIASAAYPQQAARGKCEVITLAQASQRLSALLGTDVDALVRTDPAKAKALLDENILKIADAWVTCKVTDWRNGSYVVPERTVWETRKAEETRRDKNGNKRTHTYTYTVPVTYPPYTVKYSRCNVEFELYDARTGKMVFARRDARDKEGGYDNQEGMFERITKAFFDDVGKKAKK